MSRRKRWPKATRSDRGVQYVSTALCSYDVFCDYGVLVQDYNGGQLYAVQVTSRYTVLTVRT